MKCGVTGCENECSLGTRLCKDHVDQVDEVHQSAKNVAINATPVECSYDQRVNEFVEAIGGSSEMRSLAEAMVRTGVREAPTYFSNIPADVMEQFAAIHAVGVVSSVIQERSHLLARALLLAESLPECEASGIQKLVNMEMESLREKPG